MFAIYLNTIRKFAIKDPTASTKLHINTFTHTHTQQQTNSSRKRTADMLQCDDIDIYKTRYTN